MTKYTYPTKNPEFNIIVEAETKEKADERYNEIFNKKDNN